MPCNAALRRQVKHDDNRTDEEYQEEWPNHHAHPRTPHTYGAKGMPVHTCCHKHNKATTAVEKQNGIEGHEE